MERANPNRKNRLVGWVAKKFNGSVLGQVNSILAENARRARERATPAELTQDDISQGLGGRYTDGGRARFSALMAEQGWTESDLSKRERSWRLQALLYLIGAMLALAGALAWIFAAPGWFAFIMLAPGLVVPLALLAVALKADFAAWQIRSRRFGGLREYFGSRSGS